MEAWGNGRSHYQRLPPLLDRKDMDAVIVATVRPSAPARGAGCCGGRQGRLLREADVPQRGRRAGDGEAVQAGKRIFQAGSQRVSNILYKKAAEIYASGRLGRCTPSRPTRTAIRPPAPGFIPSRRTPARRRSTGRLSARCAAAPVRPGPLLPLALLQGLRRRPGGRLFVHLLSGFQCITGINAVPSRAFSTGSLTHFNDGRDFPDLLATLYDYPGIR